MSRESRLLRRHGSVVHVYEVRCGRCKRGLLLSEGEAAPLKVGKVPFCGDCLKEGIKIQMRVRKFVSGPPDLHV